VGFLFIYTESRGNSLEEDLWKTNPVQGGDIWDEKTIGIERHATKGISILVGTYV
jgi:hypothetical protein